MLLIALVVISGFALYVMSPAERVKTARGAVGIARELVDRARKWLTTNTPFDAALQARTPIVVVTPALLALNTVTFLLMAVGSGALANPDTLLSWGGSFGPTTSNGEWWRLVTSMFVHASFFSLLMTLIGLAQIGWLVERMTGPITVAATYLGAGLFAALINLSAHPIDVQVGATAAVFGLYGLFVATVAWSLIHRSELVIPIVTLKQFAPAAGIFLLYLLGGGLERTPALAAFGSGLVGGLVLTHGIGEHKPPIRRLAATVAGTLAIAVAAAVPLRGLALVKPEIARVVDVEQRTASSYEQAVARFTTGHIKADALARIIEHDIVPELQATLTRVRALERIPLEQQPLVTATIEYLRLREDSWQARARALRSSSMVALRDADRREFVALQAFHKITPEDQK